MSVSITMGLKVLVTVRKLFICFVLEQVAMTVFIQKMTYLQGTVSLNCGLTLPNISKWYHKYPLNILHFCPIGIQHRNLQKFYKMLLGPWFLPTTEIFFILTSTKICRLKIIQRKVLTANGLTFMTVWATVILILTNILFLLMSNKCLKLFRFY
jgi:hypothetical protein